MCLSRNPPTTGSADLFYTDHNFLGLLYCVDKFLDSNRAIAVGAVTGSFLTPALLPTPRPRQQFCRFRSSVAFAILASGFGIVLFGTFFRSPRRRRPNCCRTKPSPFVVDVTDVPVGGKNGSRALKSLYLFLLIPLAVTLFQCPIGSL